MKRKTQPTQNPLIAHQTFDDARRQGLPVQEAAYRAGISHPTAYRLRKRYAAAGFPVYRSPLRRAPLPSLLAEIGLSQATVKLLQTHRIAVDCRSAHQAVRRAARDSRCTVPQRRILQRYGRGNRPLPEVLERLLHLTKTRLVKVRCGMEFTLRRSGRPSKEAGR
jgi:hypothetical protein